MHVRRSFSLLSAAVLMLGGCVGSRAPISKIDALSPEVRRAVLDLPIFSEGDLNGKEHVVIKFVEGTSCRYRRGDPPPIESDAINEAIKRNSRHFCSPPIRVQIKWEYLQPLPGPSYCRVSSRYWLARNSPPIFRQEPSN